MLTLALIFLTALVAVIYGAIVLIQIGGWLATLAAILILCYYFLSVSIFVISVGLDAIKKKMEERRK